MTPVDQIPYRRLFPWLHLFRSISLAFSARQLIVAAIAICVLDSGHIVDGVLTDRTSIAAVIGWEVSYETRLISDQPLRWPYTLISDPGRPWGDAILSAGSAFVRKATLTERLANILRCCWSIAVWALFGLALCRLAARRLTRDEQGSFRKSIQFGISRWFHGVVAPFLPAAAALVVMIPALIVLFFVRVPGIGPIIAILSSPLILICCLIASYLLIAVAIGWPLMVAAIAMDDCDGFGGLSRSYSLWTGRPWHFAWCWSVAAIVGVIVLFLTTVCLSWTIETATLAIQITAGDGTGATASLTAIRCLLGFLSRAYFISFFWTTATIVYALLRQSVDGMPMDHMAADDDERPRRDPLPVVGIPAMEPPEGIRA